MDAPPPYPDDRRGLAEFMRDHRVEILREWERRVSRLPSASGLTHEELLNHLPHLLDRIAGMVEELESGRSVHWSSADADQHALDRLDEGYDLEQVVREFSALRQCVLEMWANQPHRAVGTPVLNAAIDEAVSVAVTRYTSARDRTLVALERIGRAALEATDLGALLHDLASVLLQSAAVDSVVIYLRDGSRLVVRAAAGLEENTEQDVVEIGSETCAGRVAATLQPLEIRDVAKHPLATQALRDCGARAFYAVPMMRQENVIGVAHMASRTAYEFSHEDKLLFRSMIERVTTAVAHRQLHEALAAERMRLGAVLDALPVAVWVSNADGGVLLANKATQEVWGAAMPTPSSREGYREFKGWHADGRPVEPDEWGLSRSLPHGEAFRGEEVEIQRFDGQRAVVLVSGTPIRNDRGEIIGGISVNTDITERKSVERALRESEERFRDLADNIAQFAWMADEKGSLSWYNRRWYDYTGTTFEEMQGSGWQKVHHPDHLERVVAKFRSHIETGEPWEDTFPLRGKDGQYRWFLSRALPILDEKTGRVVRWFGTNTDITENKRINDEREAAVAREREARRVAEANAAMLDAMLVGTPIGLAFFDLELRYVRINETLAALNGKSPEEHRGRRVRDILPAAGDFLESLLRRVRDTGEPVVRVEFSHPLPGAPEQVRELELNVYPVRLGDGELVGLGAAVVDMTVMKHALRARDEFLSVASHDLRNPLASILLLVQSILRRVQSGAERADSLWVVRKLEKLRDQVHRVTGLLEDLLDVSRIQAGRIKLELDDVDIATMVRDLAARHLELLASAGCELRLDVRGHVVGRWDALRLEQVVTNLLSNAAKYGAGAPVEIRLSASNGTVKLAVQDHGVGIAPENLHRIFQRFERVGDTAAFAGTGVGLWIVKRFVEAMGGTISVESELGKGSTFTVELPRAPVT